MRREGQCRSRTEQRWLRTLIQQADVRWDRKQRARRRGRSCAVGWFMAWQHVNPPARTFQDRDPRNDVHSMGGRCGPEVSRCRSPLEEGVTSHRRRCTPATAAFDPSPTSPGPPAVHHPSMHPCALDRWCWPALAPCGPPILYSQHCTNMGTFLPSTTRPCVGR